MWGWLFRKLFKKRRKRKRRGAVSYYRPPEPEKVIRVVIK